MVGVATHLAIRGSDDRPVDLGVAGTSPLAPQARGTGSLPRRWRGNADRCDSGRRGWPDARHRDVRRVRSGRHPHTAGVRSRLLGARRRAPRAPAVRRRALVAILGVGAVSLVVYAPLLDDLRRNTDQEFGVRLRWYGWLTRPYSDLASPTLRSLAPNRPEWLGGTLVIAGLCAVLVHPRRVPLRASQRVRAALEPRRADHRNVRRTRCFALLRRTALRQLSALPRHRPARARSHRAVDARQDCPLPSTGCRARSSSSSLASVSTTRSLTPMRVPRSHSRTTDSSARSSRAPAWRKCSRTPSGLQGFDYYLGRGRLHANCAVVTAPTRSSVTSPEASSTSTTTGTTRRIWTWTACDVAGDANPHRAARGLVRRVDCGCRGRRDASTPIAERSPAPTPPREAAAHLAVDVLARELGVGRRAIEEGCQPFPPFSCAYVEHEKVVASSEPCRHPVALREPVRSPRVLIDAEVATRRTCRRAGPARCARHGGAGWRSNRRHRGR